MSNLIPGTYGCFPTITFEPNAVVHVEQSLMNTRRGYTVSKWKWRV